MSGPSPVDRVERARDLLQRLEAADIVLRLEGGAIKYDAPRGALTPALRADFGDLRQEVLQVLSEAPGREALDTQPDVPAVEGGRSARDLRLSFGQERLWFLNSLRPESVAYNVPATVSLTGALDQAALESALRALVARHEILRSSFPAVGGSPTVSIRPQSDPGAVDYAFIDHSAGGSVAREVARERALQAACEDARLPFDLVAGLPLRMRVLRVASDEHVMHLCFHHIVCDGWSVNMLFRELDTLYTAATSGAADSTGGALLEPAVQFVDLVAQARLQAERGFDRERAYWLRQLDGLSTLALPTDRPRPAVQSQVGATHLFELSEAQTVALDKLGRELGATSFHLLLTTFSVLLGRLAGQTDVVLGTPVAGRDGRREEGVVGFFINILVQRVDLAGEPGFKELVARVVDMVLDGMAHQRLPFEALIDELQPERDLGGNPLFQVLFNQFTSAPPTGLQGLEMQRLETSPEVAKFDLALHCFRTSKRITAKFEYSTDLFDAATIERWSRWFLRLIDAALADPSAALSKLDPLDEAERARLVEDWSGQMTPAPPARSVLELFADQVRERPDATALVFEQQRLSYAELDARVAAVAARLQMLGLPRDGARVGLLFERSADMIVALLGVLEAGCAYVPLDPELPSSRLAFQLEDSGASAILTHAALTTAASELAGRTTVLDITEAAQPVGRSSRPASPDLGRLAYVIYTSGTTGRPKGVEIEHAQLASYVAGLSAVLDVPAEASFATVSTLAADLGNTSIFGALCRGGALHVFSEDRVRDADAFGDGIAAGVDCIKIVPSHLTALLGAAAEPARLLPSKLLVLGGEAPSWQLVQRVRELAPQCQILNHYGPTETTVGVIVGEIPRLVDETLAAPLLGRPLPGVRAYVLGPAGELQLPGAYGELYLGGPSVARGYANRPELSARAFVPDRFSSTPGGRLYRTGDRVRFTADGRLAFAGRGDRQVKIRGHRVELAEIEAALNEHPEVGASAVRAFEEPDRPTWLCAYVVARGERPSDDSLRAHLAQRLSSAMLPSAFVGLEALPLTANGKLDRKALRRPEVGAQEGADAGYAPPTNEVERALVEIWEGVLRREGVGVHDDFFALGGESILSIQIVSRASAAGIRISPRQLFEHPTIAELAELAGSSLGPSSDASAFDGDLDGPLPLTPIQARFFESRPVDAQHYNHALLFELRRPLEPELVERASRELLERHDALRLAFDESADPAGGAARWSQRVVVDPARAPFRYFDLSELPQDEREAVAEQHADELQKSFDLSEGALLRVAQLRMGDGSDRLLIIVHHLAVDGVSWRVLLEDFEALCLGAALEGSTAPYAAWALRLAEHARTESLAAQAATWLAEVGPTAARLPLERAADAEGYRPGQSVRVFETTLDTALTATLLEEVPRQLRCGVDVVLLTALGRALAPWTGSTRTLIDLEGHGRDALSLGQESGPVLDITRTVGWFTAVYPALLDSGAEQALDALAAVASQVRTVRERGPSWGLLRYAPSALDDETQRALCELPRPEVCLNYLGRFDFTETPAGLLRPHPGARGLPASLRNRRRYPLELQALVLSGELRLSWVYDGEAIPEATLTALSERFHERLNELLSLAVTGSASRPLVPSDFPLAKLDEGELARVVADLGNTGRGGDGAQRLEDLYVATPLQQGMLYHSLAEPDSVAYVTQLHFTLEGELDAERFKRAWERVVERHAVLRTAFITEGVRELHALVLRSVELDWTEQDGRDWAPERIDELARTERATGFELDRPALMRFRLVRLGARRHAFIWTHHHALLDGWSLPLVMREVWEIYRGAQPAQAPAPFADYVAWLASQDAEQALVTWRERLAGWGEPTALPFSSSSGPGSGEAGADLRHTVRSRELSLGATAALTSMARGRRITMNTLVQGAWALVLARYAGESEVVFGVTVAGRPAELAGVESMIGLFINTLPLRVAIEDRDVTSWLQAIQSQQLDLQGLEGTPLYEIQRVAETRGGTLFDSIVVFENYPFDEAGLGADADGVRIVHAVDDSFSNFPMALVVRPGKQLHLELRCAGSGASLIRAEEVERVLAELERVLGVLAAEPAARVGALPRVGASERRLQLEEWNATRSEYPHEARAHELFEVCAREHAEAIAISAGSEALSYAALDRRANGLASELQALGVQRGDRVAVALERGIEPIVAFLAILKCGAAYVPIDREQPRPRLERIVSDARPVACVLTSVEDAGRLALEGLPSLLLADIEERSESPQVPGSSDDLAYVIYTSGSTGNPKGVCVSHRAIVRLVRDTNYVYLGPDDKVAQASTMIFDAATFEIFGALLNGAELVLVERDVLLSTEDLAARIRERGISVMFITTALFHQHVAQDPELFAPLKTLLFGGEIVDPRRVREVFEQGCPGTLSNVYGPTENTTFSTKFEIVDLADSPRGVPIGRPISNTTCHVLDVDGQLVPVGARGELYLGGDGVALEYLNDPELTQRKFVRDPFGPPVASRAAGASSARLYRTGDLVRWRVDGALEFLGRVDDQIKLRGFRIELGEVESALVRQPGVREATVLLDDGGSAGPRLVAWVVAESSERKPQLDELRASAREALPAYMVPDVFVFLDALPLTVNGKIDRKALASLAPAGSEGAPGESQVLPRGELEQRIASIWREVLGLTARDPVGREQNFFDLGGHSLRLLRMRQLLSSELGSDVTITELFQFPTIAELAERLGGSADSAPQASLGSPLGLARAGAKDDGIATSSDGIAIIGMAGRFPGAATIEQFWSNLAGGVESVRFFDDEELLAAGVPEDLIRHPRYVKARAILDDVDQFDAALFGFSPREAELLDPQQRVFLECAWEGLERAGYDPRRFPGAIAVFAGMTTSSYVQNLRSHPGLLESLGGMQAQLVTDKDYIATRVSYQLGLHGPSMTVQSACSTGLVAIHEACNSLLTGESDIALAGGVCITVPNVLGYLYEPGGIRSSDGHNRTFDARAEGTVSGNGSAVVVLKRLAHAVRDGDVIHAVVRGSALNNDGSQKVGFTAPSVLGQAAAIALAQRRAGVDPSSIRFVEAHGTATALGDPIEVAALTRAFRENSAGELPTGFCGLGSLKSNMGHLNEAAGVAGVIKTALALEHRYLPPSLHYESPNSEIDFDSSPFYVVAQGEDLSSEASDPDAPLRAAVSSFGLGGTNAHAILEQAPEREPSGAARSWQLLVLSARSRAALDTASANLAAHLRAHADELERSQGRGLADIAYTLQVGRRQFAERRAVVCRSVEEAIEALEGRQPELVFTARASERPRSVAFLFPGHGHQHPGMARELYESEPVFREAFDACRDALVGLCDFDLRELLYPDPGAATGVTSDELLAQARLFQPAIFAVNHALAKLWQAWGLEPEVCLGHSLGEFSAAHQAGVLDLQGALRTVCLRGELMAATPAGAMLAVPLSAEQLAPHLEQATGVWLSTHNAPGLCLVSGEPEGIARFATQLEVAGVESSALAAAHAYHSPMMESGRAPLKALAEELVIGSPAVPYPSNVSGDWISAEQLEGSDYWGRHLCEPVRFAEGLARVLEDPDRVLLEVGPGQTLTGLCRMTDPTRTVVASLRHPKAETSDTLSLAGALARLWTAGVAIDWEGFHAAGARRRVVLPTYPFERGRFWIERRPEQPSSARAAVADWFYGRAWRPLRVSDEPRRLDVSAGQTCLAFVDQSPTARAVLERLSAAGLSIVRVEAGAAFSYADERATIDPRSEGDYQRLVESLVAEQRAPVLVAHLWNLSSPDPVLRGSRRPSREAADEELRRSFFSLFWLARALDAASVGDVRIVAVSRGVHQVLGDETLCAERASLVGPCRVIGVEFPQLTCRLVDLGAQGDVEREAELLADELCTLRDEPVLALRGGARLVESFTRLSIGSGSGASPASQDHRLQPGRVVLVTGGLSGVGLELARALAKRGAKLVLVGRTPIPEPEAWERWLEEHAQDDATSRRIRGLRELQEQGAELIARSVDVADSRALRAVCEAAVERFGGLHGIVHAAGIHAGGLMAVQEPDRPWQSFEPKIAGTAALAALAGEHELDFIVLCSSLNAVMGTPGVADYAAANAYLDAFAGQFSAETGTRCISIAWNRWRSVGMAAEAARRAGGQVDSADGITNAEGAEVFLRILEGAEDAQVLVSETDLWTRLAATRARIEAEVALPGSSAAEAGANGELVSSAGLAGGPSSGLHPRPDLPVEYAPPETPTEKILAEIWQQTLGIEQVGVFDSFLELGGSSLLMLRVTSALEQRTGVKINLRALFHHTLGQCAAMVDESAPQKSAASPARAPGEASSSGGAGGGLVKGLVSRMKRMVGADDDSQPGARD